MTDSQVLTYSFKMGIQPAVSCYSYIQPADSCYSDIGLTRVYLSVTERPERLVQTRWCRGTRKEKSKKKEQERKSKKKLNK